MVVAGSMLRHRHSSQRARALATMPIVCNGQDMTERHMVNNLDALVFDLA